MDTKLLPAPGRRPALVLGGGGAYGVIQAAYIHAAAMAGFRPTLVVGTSVGALNGAWLSLHPDDSGNLLRIWLTLDKMRIFHLNPYRLARKIARGPMGLMDNDIVPALIDEYIGDLQFSDAHLPLGVVATSLSRSCKHVFTEGSLGSAILASTAIPGVYDPIEIDGELFVDGCLTASVDLLTAHEMGATEILAIDLTPPAPTFRPKTLVGVLRQSFGILTHATTDAMESAVSQLVPVTVVRPDLTSHSPWRLDDSASAIAHNLQLAHRAIETVIGSDGHLACAQREDRALPVVSTVPSNAVGPLELRRFLRRRQKQVG